MGVNSTRTRIYSRKRMCVLVLCEDSKQVGDQVQLYSVPATNLSMLRHKVPKDPLPISDIVAVSRANPRYNT